MSVKVQIELSFDTPVISRTSISGHFKLYKINQKSNWHFHKENFHPVQSYFYLQSDSSQHKEIFRLFSYSDRSKK